MDLQPPYDPVVVVGGWGAALLSDGLVTVCDGDRGNGAEAVRELNWVERPGVAPG